LRVSEAKQIQEIGGQTLALLEEIGEHHADQERVNRLIARVDSLRSRMDGLGRTYKLVTELTQSSELLRFEADRLLAAAKLDGLDRQRRQVARDIDNVHSVVAAAGEFAGMVARIIDQMEKDARSIAGQREAA
jgi:hypothetical protein